MNPARAVLEECAEAVRTIVRAHRAQSGSVKRALHQAADEIGITTRRAEAFWWGEASAVPAHEADAIRHALAALHAGEAARLAADLERHQRGRVAAREALRPTLQLRSPPAPIQQRRLAL